MTAISYANLVKVLNTTSGTGTITLGAAVSGFRGTSALTNSKTYQYSILGSGTYETGYGVYTASGTTLTRNVYESSNSDTAVTLTGTEIVIIGIPLAQTVTSPGSDTQIFFNDGGIANASAGFIFSKSTNNVTIANTLTIGTATVNSSVYTGTSNNSTYFNTYTWTAPAALGGGTANSGAFTTITGTTSILIGAVGNNVTVNTTAVLMGNSSVFASVNSSIYTGTANNATYLGGVGSGSYLTTSSNYTITGLYTFNSNVTIGTSGGIIANGTIGTSGQVLTSNGSTVYWATAAGGGGGGATLVANNTDTQTFYIPMANTTSGTWSNAVVSTTQMYFVPSSGALSAISFNSLSDINYKTNIESISNIYCSTGVIKNLRGVSFDWIHNGEPSFGLIAQEVENILPELVEESNGKKTVNYSGLIGFLVESIKELNERIRFLENDS